MNRLEDYAETFEGVELYRARGEVPPGYSVDFLGILTDQRFKEVASETARARQELPAFPLGKNAEVWIETVNWFAAARAACNRFVMITLGACYGAQAVGSIRALQLVNPMPYKVVAVEPVPEQCAWVAQHMRDNGIDPDEQWIVSMAISSETAPVLFPVGASGSGSQNCVSTNGRDARLSYVKQLTFPGRTRKALRNVLLHNTTGIMKGMAGGDGLPAEVKFVSAITLKELLGPFDVVDYLESDIQQSEILVFPPFMDLLKRKVRRIHIGTHGPDVHWTLHRLFEQHGWEMVFSYEPNSEHESALGRFKTNDGILTVCNPDL